MHCRRCGGLLESKDVLEHGRKEKRLVCGCGQVFYDNPVPVVMCLVESTIKGQPCVLMTRNVDSPPGMPLVFVAGFLEKTDKSPSSGMARELSEEVGLSSSSIEGRLKLLGVAMFVRLNQLIILYTLRLIDGEVPVRNEQELADMAWVPLHKLKISSSWDDGPLPLVKAWVSERLQATTSKL